MQSVNQAQPSRQQGSAFPIAKNPAPFCSMLSSHGFLPSSPFCMNVQAPLSFYCLELLFLFVTSFLTDGQIYIQCVLVIPNPMANVASHS